jgi:hypothetical protein
MSLSTQAIKLDHNRLSCPTPSNYLTHQNVHIQIGKNVGHIHLIESMFISRDKNEILLYHITM